MTHCYYCKSTIFIGGKKQGNLRFCGNSCFLKGQYLLLTAQLPNKVVNDKINAVHQGACPKCNRRAVLLIYILLIKYGPLLCFHTGKMNLRFAAEVVE